MDRGVRVRLRPHLYWLAGVTSFFAIPITLVYLRDLSTCGASDGLFCYAGPEMARAAASMVGLLLVVPVLLGHIVILAAQLVDGDRPSAD